MSTRRTHLATRLMTAQALVIAVGAITLLVTAALVAPGLFHAHLGEIGGDSPNVAHHAEEAFASSFAVAISVATAVSLIAAGLVSWFLVRRLARPVEELAAAAESVATGNYDVTVPDAVFSSELQQLSSSFAHMATRLAETESSRTRLLADLAHEVRTPLATLEAYIDGLEDGVVQAEPVAYTTMRAQVSRLRRLATDLREAAAANEHALNLSFADLDPAEAATSAVAAALPRYLAKGVSLDMQDSPTGLVVTADAERLQQVLANLLDNALRHTPVGGHVTVAVRQTTGRTTDITVTDDGEGIPDDHLAQIFERFHRVDPSRATHDGSGSGLGLTIARAIITDHGGSLTVTSSGLNRGSTFTVALPALPAPRPI
ncbi:MAG: HAMP domain-containing protein [Frankiales bacterium]|nr:HAMP domain-containing protein [Frankiales bacterium]